MKPNKFLMKASTAKFFLVELLLIGPIGVLLTFIAHHLAAQSHCNCPYSMLLLLLPLTLMNWVITDPGSSERPSRSNKRPGPAH